MMAAPRRSLASDAFAIAVGSVFTQGAALLSTVVLARILPPAELGSYQQLFLLYAILSPLLLGGVPAALLYFLAAEPEAARRRGWVTASYVLVIATGAVFSLLVLLGRGVLSEAMNNDRLDEVLLLWAPYPLLLFISAVMPNALVATGRARHAAAFNALFAAIFLVFVVVAAMLGEDTKSATVGLVGSAVVSSVISVIVVARTVGVASPSAAVSRRLRQMLAYGVPLALTGLTGMLGFQFDRIVVTSRFSPEEFAVYALGAVEIPIAVLVQQAVNNVLVPALTRHWRAGDVAGMIALWREAIRKTSLVLLPVFGFGMVFAGDIIRLLFGATYEDSVPIFRIYLCLMPLRVATYGIIPMAIGRTRINLSAAVVLLVSNVVLVLSLVGPLELSGPAVASVLATGVVAVYYLVRLRRILGVGVRALFPWRMLGINLSLSCLVALPTVPIAMVEAPGLVRLMAGGAVYGLGYVAVMRRLRRIDDDDWSRLRASWRRLPGGRAAGGAA